MLVAFGTPRDDSRIHTMAHLTQHSNTYSIPRNMAGTQQFTVRAVTTQRRFNTPKSALSPNHGLNATSRGILWNIVSARDEIFEFTDETEEMKQRVINDVNATVVDVWMLCQFGSLLYQCCECECD